METFVSGTLDIDRICIKYYKNMNTMLKETKKTHNKQLIAIRNHLQKEGEKQNIDGYIIILTLDYGFYSIFPYSHDDYNKIKTSSSWNQIHHDLKN